MSVVRHRTLLVGLLAASWAVCARAADVVIGVPNWPSVNATAHILQELMQANFGIGVELQTATNPVIFEAMAKGSIQIHPEVWLPNQQALYDKYSDALIVSRHPAVGVQGFCVDRAARDAGINDVSDLTDPVKAALLASDGSGRGEIFIGAPGWSSTSIERLRAAQYGYELVLRLTEIDEGLADSQLAIAEKRNKPWVGFCYAPNHRFVMHRDLSLLTEPPYDASRWRVAAPTNVAMAWPPQSIRPMYTKTLARQFPGAAKLVGNMDLTREDLSSFAYEIVINKRDPAEFAEDWISRHPERVSRWLR
jgi:glycine betaine/proline transport system substrate-binding protein